MDLLQKSLVLLNPALDNNLKIRLNQIVLEQQMSEPHTWLTSSGSSASSQREIKLIGLSNKALLASAAAVNQHLGCQKSDRWLNVLPKFHVGGLGIIYRANLSSSEMINLHHDEFKWNPSHFYQTILNEKISLTSLVPTQVYDLVTAGYKSPPSLRAVVIGGASLSILLYKKARQLGWPLLPSYGMTEVCSQIATASICSLDQTYDNIDQTPQLQILNHMTLESDEENCLSIKSPSLMSYCIQLGESSEVRFFKENTWYKTHDRVQITDNTLTILGRVDDMVKILGENVNLTFLREKLSQIFIKNQVTHNWALISTENQRKGQHLVLIIEISTNTNTQSEVSSVLPILESSLIEFNQQVLPFERLNQVNCTKIIPKSSLGKILYGSITINQFNTTSLF